MLNLVLVLLHIFFHLIFGTWAQYILVVADFAVLILMRCVSPFPGSSSLLLAADLRAACVALVISLRAYYDSDHLSRYKIFFIGELADGWVRAE